MPPHAATLLAAFPLVAIHTLGCTTTTTEDAVVAQTPPTLIVVSLGSATPSADGGAVGCVERDERGVVPLRVVTTAWTFRPPGACSVLQCGQLAVRVDGAPLDLEHWSAPAARLWAAPFAEVALQPGARTVDVELVADGTADAVLDADGERVRVRLLADVREVGGCGDGGAASDAGAPATDADGDAASD